jgi:microcystin-dependent protein
MKMLRYVTGFLIVALALVGISIMGPIGTHAQLASVQTWAGAAGGTSNAPILTIHNVISLTDLTGVPIRFLPNGTNTTGVTITINLDGGGTLSAPLDRPIVGVGNYSTLSGAELNQNVMTEIVYLPSPTAAFVIVSPFDPTPVGTSIDVRGTTAPQGYLIEDGSCVSTTLYAALFSVIGNNYGGCSAGNFELPDSRGTLFAVLDNQGSRGAAGRINTAGSGCNAVGIVYCGLQNSTLQTANLPPYTPSGAVTFAGSSNPNLWVNSGGLDVPAGSSLSFSSGGALAFVGAAQGGTSTPFSNLPPILLGLKAIKF